MTDEQAETLHATGMAAAWATPNGLLFIADSSTHGIDDHLTMIIYDAYECDGRVIGFIHIDAVAGLVEMINASALCDQVRPDVAFAVMEADGAARRRSADEA